MNTYNIFHQTNHKNYKMHTTTRATITGNLQKKKMFFHPLEMYCNSESYIVCSKIRKGNDFTAASRTTTGTKNWTTRLAGCYMMPAKLQKQWNDDNDRQFLFSVGAKHNSYQKTLPLPWEMGRWEKYIYIYIQRTQRTEQRSKRKIKREEEQED